DERTQRKALAHSEVCLNSLAASLWRARCSARQRLAAKRVILMNITIPIYVQSHRDTYLVRPLFFPRPIQQHEKLERVLHLLAGELRKVLRELGKMLRHEDLAAWTFCPDLDYRRLDLVI